MQKTHKQVKEIVSQISLGQILYKDPEFRVMKKGDGFLLQLTYWEEDTANGEPKLGVGMTQQFARKWYVSSWSTTTEIVRTAHKAVMASLEHRLGEHFRFQGAQVYSPHHSVHGLVGLTRTSDFDVREPKPILDNND